jgi:hypothetical protein
VWPPLRVHSPVLVSAVRAAAAPALAQVFPAAAGPAGLSFPDP